MAMFLCISLLSVNMQTIQPVYAKQFSADEKEILEESLGQEESGTFEEGLEEINSFEKDINEEDTISETPNETGEINETNNTGGMQSEEETDFQESELEETETVEEELLATEEDPIVFSEIMVNPLYADIIDKAGLASEIERIYKQEDCQSESAAVDKAGVFTSIEDAASYLREQMVQRNNIVSFYISQSLYDTDSTVLNRIVNSAVEHTEKCSGRTGGRRPKMGIWRI